MLRELSSGKQGSLTQALISELVIRIERQIYRPGERMPSEQQLCKEFGVSRTVVREAVASIRLSGRLFSKPGVGVFVTEDVNVPIGWQLNLNGDRRAALHIMELRIGLEVEAAGLAAERRTAQGVAEIVKAYDEFDVLRTDQAAAIDSDFAFHLAIARASNNPHYPQLLESTIKEITSDLQLKREGRDADALQAYEERIQHEHGVIVTAIIRKDPGAARAAMYRHLSESIVRYKNEQPHDA